MDNLCRQGYADNRIQQAPLRVQLGGYLDRTYAHGMGGCRMQVLRGSVDCRLAP